MQVEDVTLARRGEQVVGTLHLTPHHIIFVQSPVTNDGEKCPRPRELWITYPIISFCTLRPAPTASRQPSSIRLRCRDFTFVCFYFASEIKARDVYDSIKAWTCKLGRIEKLYAFTYQPQPPEKDVNYWGLYDPVKEWRRMGVGDPSRKNQWRISNINRDYSVWLLPSSKQIPCLTCAVFTYIPVAAPRSVLDIRQYAQLCRTLPFESKDTSLDVPTSHQRLLDYTILAAACWSAPK